MYAPMGMNHANQAPHYNYDPQVNGGHASQAGQETFIKLGQNNFSMRKRRLNLVAIVVSLFVPWVLFCGLSALFSFESNYKRPLMVIFLASMGMALVLWMGSVALSSTRARAAGDFSSQPSWYWFLFATSFLAWFLAVFSGHENFAEHTQSYYDIKNLNVYENVDPATMRGAQVMDGGRITFDPRSSLDIKRSMGFKNDRTYCVAPITSSDLPLAAYDFWAVGLDCCSGEAADFKCDDYANRKAHGGLRMMKDELRPFYRLAVQQAEAKHQIKATHPLFFHWVEDPEERMNAYKLAGYKYYFTGMLAHFGFQFVIVVLAACTFASGGL